MNVSVERFFQSTKSPNTRLRRPPVGYSNPDSGKSQRAYVLYGSSTMMVYTSGNGVHGFTLDPSLGAFVLSHEHIKMPRRAEYYSVNEGYRDSFPRAVFEFFFDELRGGLAESSIRAAILVRW